MPYAAKAKIEHEYDAGTLRIYITFRSPMKMLYKPDDDLWIVKLDNVLTNITSSVWSDMFTMLLVIDGLGAKPDRVTVEYDGPSENLETIWDKQWEKWAAIFSQDLTALLFITGMILLWSGAIVDIPDGWNICDGTNGTPDLTDKFIIAAGNTYNPGDSGGSASHNHTASQAAHNHNTFPPFGTALTGTAPVCSNNAQPAITVVQATQLQPYYALAFIMKI